MLPLQGSAVTGQVQAPVPVLTELIRIKPQSVLRPMDGVVSLLSVKKGERVVGSSMMQRY